MVKVKKKNFNLTTSTLNVDVFNQNIGYVVLS